MSTLGTLQIFVWFLLNNSPHARSRRVKLVTQHDVTQPEAQHIFNEFKAANDMIGRNVLHAIWTVEPVELD